MKKGIYQGCNNSFLLIEDWKKEVTPSPEEISSLCQEVDGLILLQSSEIGDALMRIFNRDGSEAESCGNGLRSFLLFMEDLGIQKSMYRIEVGGNVVTGWRENGLIAINMGFPKLHFLSKKIASWEVHFVDTGVPHGVVLTPQWEVLDLPKEAPLLRHHPLFAPRGINVNFAWQESQSLLRMRTFERGVEGETAACGTGALAVSYVSHLLSGGISFQLETKGGTLWTEKRREGWILLGPAAKI